MNQLTREQVLAFRLDQHWLSKKATSDQLLQVATLGIQNTPPDSALLALGARLQDFSPEKLNQALITDKTLIHLWSLRSAPYIVPVTDLPVFTMGLLPAKEADCLYMMRGAAEHLRKFNLTATQAVELTTNALLIVLGRGIGLSKEELGIRLAEEMIREIPVHLHSAWNSPDGMRKNTYGRSIARYALNVVSLSGVICLTPPAQKSRATRLMLTEKWLGQPALTMDLSRARAALVKSFLQFYGPGDIKGYASWAGVSQDYAQESWSMISTELSPVTIGKRQHWMLAQDLKSIQSAQLAYRVHMLPPHDPYLSAPDKAMLVPDPTLRQRIWRRAGSPGIVLIAGEVAGIWQPSKKGKSLILQVELFRPPTTREHSLINLAAQEIANLRQVNLIAVKYA